VTWNDLRCVSPLESPFVEHITLIHVVCVLLLFLRIEPRFLVANHNYRERPVQLYWFDVDAMQKLVQRPGAVLVTSYRDGDSNDGDDAHNDKKNQDSGSDREEDGGGENGQTVLQPVRPTLESLQEFKVSPAVHAAYAFTWFSLSLAGLIMTRRLATAASGTTAKAKAAAAAGAASRGASASAGPASAAASAGGARRL
jgi:cytochrome oxidase assembly protein ShyY1